MDGLLIVIVCVMIGILIGMFMISLCVVAKQADRDKVGLKPAARFFTNTPDEQIAHVLSEVSEIMDASKKLAAPRLGCDLKELRNDVMDEITDAETALKTLTVIYGFTDQEINDSRSRVISKNADRGYYDD